jgi:cysteine desulfurase
MAEALNYVRNEHDQREEHVTMLRDHIIAQVLETIPDSKLTGHPKLRLPNHASFVLKGVDGNTLLMLLDIAGFACSSGSACKTGNPKPSSVLTALGLTRTWGLGSLRVTVGKDTSIEDVNAFLAALPGIVAKVRKL